MKELLFKLVKVGVEFGIMEKVKGGVRDWSKMLGKGKEDMEEMIKRIIVGCCENFNYVEGGVEGLKSEVMWEWVRDGYWEKGLEKFNMVEKRKELYKKCIDWLWKYENYNGEWSILKEVVKYKWFWEEMWEVFGKDVVWKRVSLCRMMLKDMGVEIYDMGKKEIVVDYNLMCVFKYMGWINYKGGFEDSKDEVDLNRVIVYEVMSELLKLKGLDESWLDGLLFMLGRELRKRGLVNVCLYNGCIDY